MKGAAYDPLKRAVDVVVGGIGLLLTLPLQGLVALAVRIDLGSPVFFRQERPGKDEKIFELVKFRTMHESHATRGPETDRQRLSRFGALLRSTSLDELPSLWNVVKGDMSLVGPRPLLVQYLVRYSAEQRRRHEVRPGITGLAQVSGRNAITWDQKFAYDVEYVERRSLRLDLTIVGRTFAQVVKRNGISAEGEVTMGEFTGNGHG